MPWNNITTYSTGQKVTAAVWEDVVENMAFLEEINYTEFTSDVSVTATTVGTANQIVSAGAIDYEASPILIEFQAGSYNPPAQTTFFILRDSTTVIGTLVWIQASGLRHEVKVAHRLTPTAASHTYNVAAWLGGAGTGTVEGGSGGTAGNDTTMLPGFIRITRVPT